MWKLVECCFLVGLGESSLVEPARPLKKLPLAGNNNAFQLYFLAMSCHWFMHASFSKGKLNSVKKYLSRSEYTEFSKLLFVSKPHIETKQQPHES